MIYINTECIYIIYFNWIYMNTKFPKLSIYKHRVFQAEYISTVFQIGCINTKSFPKWFSQPSFSLNIMWEFCLPHILTYLKLSLHRFFYTILEFNLGHFAFCYLKNQMLYLTGYYLSVNFYGFYLVLHQST